MRRKLRQSANSELTAAWESYGGKNKKYTALYGTYKTGL